MQSGEGHIDLRNESNTVSPSRRLRKSTHYLIQRRAKFVHGQRLTDIPTPIPPLTHTLTGAQAGESPSLSLCVKWFPLFSCSASSEPDGLQSARDDVPPRSDE